MLKTLTVTGFLVLAMTASGCVIIIDKDDDDGDTGVTVKTWDEYEDQQEREAD